MIRVHLTYNKKRGAYDLRIIDSLPLAANRAKSAVEFASDAVKELSVGFGPVSLRIHTRAGKIKEERTYPRSADPKETKG